MKAIISFNILQEPDSTFISINKIDDLSYALINRIMPQEFDLLDIKMESLIR